MYIINCKSWDDFKTSVIKKLEISCNFEKGNFLFRGQADPSWSLSSSFDRLGKDKSKYQSLLSNFKKVLERHQFDENLLKQSDIVISAFAQHHGLPTRLVDWTESPYVAAFFSFSDIVSLNIKKRQTCIYAINKNSKALKSETGLEFIEIPMHQFNKRLSNQMGQFTLSSHSENTIMDYIKNIDQKHSVDESLWQFNIPTNNVNLVLDDLALMGINHSSVYPDLQGYIQEVKFKLFQ